MDKLIFRNDDVNPCSDMTEIKKIYEYIKEVFPKSEILSCVTLFSKWNTRGSVYEQVPFKSRPKKWFYDVDSFVRSLSIPGKIVSHGLFHCNHSGMSYDAQEMSILSSCKYLITNKFMPPFNKWDETTFKICKDNGIDLIVGDWKGLEFEKFDSDYNFWYFHSWRYDLESFKRVLNGNSVNVGQL